MGAWLGWAAIYAAVGVVIWHGCRFVLRLVSGDYDRTDLDGE